MGKQQPASKLKDAVLNEQLEHLQQMGVPAYVSNIAIALLISYVYWQRAPLLALGLSTVVVAISAVRYIFFRYYQSSSSKNNAYYWSRLYSIGSLFSGLSWGIGLTLLANYLGGIDFFVILTAAIVVSVTGFISISSHLQSLSLFFYPLMLPLTVSTFFYYQIPLMLAAGIILVVYMLVSWFLSTNNYRLLVRGMIYRQHNFRLRKKLQASNRELLYANQRLEALSATDPLTGLANRRHFDHFLQREFQQSKRDDSPLTLILLDIDFFKAFNDNYGHLSGDEILGILAQVLRQSLTRPMDLVARFGGEEFIIVLPCTNLEGAINIAERIQENIKKLNIKHAFSLLEEKRLTCSMGIAEIQASLDRDEKNLLYRTDQALYQAKEAGRNCYKIA